MSSFKFSLPPHTRQNVNHHHPTANLDPSKDIEGALGASASPPRSRWGLSGGNAGEGARAIHEWSWKRQGREHSRSYDMRCERGLQIPIACAKTLLIQTSDPTTPQGATEPHRTASERSDWGPRSKSIPTSTKPESERQAKTTAQR